MLYSWGASWPDRPLALKTNHHATSAALLKPPADRRYEPYELKTLGRTTSPKPLLMVDIDGVISLFGRGPLGPAPAAPGRAGRVHSIDGIPHFLSSTAAAHLLALAATSTWSGPAAGRRRPRTPPRLLGLPAALPFLRFSRAAGRGNAHWKLEAIDTSPARAAGLDRRRLQPGLPRVGRRRAAPTLLVRPSPRTGSDEGGAAAG